MTHGRTIVAASLLLAVLLQLPLWSWTIDESGIGLAYARNVAAGLGAVPYPGAERLELYASPLWVCGLAGASWWGMEPLGAARWLGLLGGVGAVAATASWWGWRTSAGVLAAWLVASSYAHALWSASGLEHGLFAGLLALTGWRLLKGGDRDRLGPLGLLLLGLARPEGVALAAVGGVWWWAQAVGSKARGVRAVRLATWVVLPLLIYASWRFVYFAEALPSGVSLRFSVQRWLVVVGFGAAVGALIRRLSPAPRLAGVWLWAAVAAVVLIESPGPWLQKGYTLGLVPLAVLLGSLGAAIWERWEPPGVAASTSAAAVAVVCLAVQAPAYVSAVSAPPSPLANAAAALGPYEAAARQLGTMRPLRVVSRAPRGGLFWHGPPRWLPVLEELEPLHETAPADLADRAMSGMQPLTGVPGMWARSELVAAAPSPAGARRQVDASAVAALAWVQQQTSSTECAAAEDALAAAVRQFTRETQAELRAALATSLVECWSKSARGGLRGDALWDRIADLERARSWVPDAEVLEIASHRVSAKAWHRAMAALDRGEPQVAYQWFSASLRAHPSKAWARRFARQAQAD